MKQLKTPQNHNNVDQNEVEESEVQAIISNAERLRQITETLGFDNIANSEPAMFVRDWLSQFMGFGQENTDTMQKGSNGGEALNETGTAGKDSIKQNGRMGSDKITPMGGKSTEIKPSKALDSSAKQSGNKKSTNGISPPNTISGKGPQICSVYTHTTEVMFNDESVKVYFNARDPSWDDLTWDTKWTGSFTGDIKNEGPETWTSKEFNLVEMGAQAGDNFTVETTVRNSKGETDTRSVTYDVIGEEIAVWEVFFDSQSVNEDGYGTPERIDPLIFDLNKDGQLDITGANQAGNGELDGDTVLFDMDPRKQGTAGWKHSSPGHRPGYYEGGNNSRAPKVPNGTVVYNTGKTESTNKAGVGRWFEDRSKGNKADIFDENGNLVGQWDESTWGESHGGRKGQYYWESKGGGEHRERTEWIKGTGDGFLVWDHNNNGIIDDNTEMMSEFDIEGNKEFNNGFEKLAHYFDKDNDGIIKGNELNGLKFWVDDGDAITEDGELQTLASYGIMEIRIPGGDNMTSTSIAGKAEG